MADSVPVGGALDGRWAQGLAMNYMNNDEKSRMLGEVSGVGWDGENYYHAGLNHFPVVWEIVMWRVKTRLFQDDSAEAEGRVEFNRLLLACQDMFAEDMQTAILEKIWELLVEAGWLVEENSTFVFRKPF